MAKWSSRGGGLAGNRDEVMLMIDWFAGGVAWR